MVRIHSPRPINHLQVRDGRSTALALRQRRGLYALLRWFEQAQVMPSAVLTLFTLVLQDLNALLQL